MNPSSRTRLLEMLADRALEGLSAAEEADLARLLADHPDVDPHSLDIAAAMVAATDPEQAVELLPEELRRRIEEQALAMPPFKERATLAGSGQPMASLPSRLRRLAVPWAGWALAAGLLLAMGTLGFINRQPTLTEKFERFRADVGATVLAEGRAPDPKATPEVAGEIYWSGSRQEGFMKLRGLPVNDPKAKQYQLWIFDKQRDERHPVDGGVFDVNTAGEVLIPIDARVPVHHASLFVITQEPPGGVVVSDRKNIVLIAAVQ
jgi:hypothetical protein